MTEPRLDAVSDDELHAFVDAQLHADRLPAVLAWLLAHPADATRVAAWQGQRFLLRQLAQAQTQAQDLAETPAALTDVVLRTALHGRRYDVWWQAAAAVLVLALGVGAGHWWGQSEATVAHWDGAGSGPNLARAPRDESPAFVRDAVLAHAVFVPEKRHPVEVAAADQAHLVQWLSRRLGTPLKAPVLTDRGYSLLGGRLLPGEGVPRAQFMYENAQGARVTLYVAVFAPGQAPVPTSFRSVHDGANESFYWVEDHFGYALSGELAAAELQVLAREVYAQLTQ